MQKMDSHPTGEDAYIFFLNVIRKGFRFLILMTRGLCLTIHICSTSTTHTSILRFVTLSPQSSTFTNMFTKVMTKHLLLLSLATCHFQMSNSTISHASLMKFSTILIRVTLVHPKLFGVSCVSQWQINIHQFNAYNFTRKTINRFCLKKTKSWKL